MKSPARTRRPRVTEAEATPRRWTITIPRWYPATVNRLLRNRWQAARLKRDDRMMVAGYAMLAGIPKATGKRRVSIEVRVPNASRAPDPDNLLKSGLDAIVKAGLLIDDRAEWCELGTVSVAKGPHATTIVIEGLDEPEGGRAIVNARTQEKPLTLAELAERWGCTTETVLDRVRTRGVPFVWLGRGEPRLTEAGRKFLVFRRAAIEEWERANERVWPKADEPPVPSALPAAGWDGIDRLGGRRRRRSPGA